MDERKLGAKLGEEYINGKINWATFIDRFPQDNEDSDLVELFDLVEHESPVGKWYDIGTISQKEHEEYISAIKRLIDKLK